MTPLSLKKMSLLLVVVVVGDAVVVVVVVVVAVLMVVCMAIVGKASRSMVPRALEICTPPLTSINIPRNRVFCSYNITFSRSIC